MRVGHASAAGEIDEVLDRLLEETGADAAEMFVREPGGSRMWLAAHRGLAERDFRERTDFEVGEGFPGLVAAHGEPILTLHLDRDRRYLRPRAVRRGFRCYLCVPVRAGDEIVGSLHVAARERQEAVVGRAGLLGEAAERLAGLVELARLRAKDRIGDAPAAPELDAKRNLRRRVGLALEAMAEVTGADGGIVLLRDPATGTLHPWGWSGAFERACGAVTHGAGACACTVIHQGRGLVAPSRADGTPKRCRVAPADFARVACVPLVVEATVLGAVSLGYATRGPLPGRLINELGAMAQRLALEVANAQAAVAGEDRAATAHELSLLGRVEDLVERSVRAAVQRTEQGGGETIEVHDLVARVSAEARTPAPPAAPHLDVRCLGELVVYRDGQRIDAAHLGRRRAWTLLKILLAEYGRTVDDEVLIDRLWPRDVPPGAAKQLKVLVHDLRRALAPGPQPAGTGRFVTRRGSGYAFDTQSSHRLDSREFAGLVSRGERRAQHGDVDGALAAYRAAADLYTGDFLADERYSDWCAPERDWLRERHLALLRHTATLLLARDDVDGAVACHRRALRVDDTLEDVHGELIAVLLQAGRRGDALRQYEACRRALRAGMDREPRPETTALVAGLGGPPAG